MFKKRKIVFTIATNVRAATVKLVSCPDPTRKVGEGLGTLELFLGCADSAVI